MDLQPGMVVARPVFGGSGIKMTLHIAVGSAITANTIAQLINKGVECIAVRQDALPDPDEYAASVARYASRLQEIFGPAPNEDCRPLYEALLALGPPQC